MVSNGLMGQLIIFSLAGRLFGLDVTLVQEILPKVPIRSLPRAALYLRGVIDFRGQIIPVLDLGRLLGLPVTETVASIVVIQSSGRNYGLMVDGVKEVLTVDAEPSQQASSASADLPERFLLGNILSKEGPVMVLNISQLLAQVQQGGGVS